MMKLKGLIDPINCIKNIYSCIILEEYIGKFESWLRFELRKDTDAVRRPVSTETVYLCFWQTLFNCFVSFFDFSYTLEE